jgi:hypothetical protein
VRIRAIFERVLPDLRIPARPRTAWALWLLLLAAGCSGTSGGGVVASNDTGATGDDATTLDDALPLDDALVDTAAPVDDGVTFPPVRRLACVPLSGLAHDLPITLWGAVEADLVAITPPGAAGNCPNDSGHVHLQLDITGKRYDVAVNIESTAGDPMSILTKDLPAQLPGLGYSNSSFDYPLTLGVHSTDFVAIAKAALVTRLQSELKNASRVSIHGLTYTDGSGIHDVHKNNPGHDGVILVRRGGAGGSDHAIALKFSTDVF